MYYEKFFPFHAVNADSGLFEGEAAMEREFELMKSWFPGTARQIQEQAQEQCRLLDYEGSPLYDEYPDKFMLRRMCEKIRRSVDKTLFVKEGTDAETKDGAVSAQWAPAGFLDDLIEVVLYQEISRRRCRRRRCRGYGGPGGTGGPGRGSGGPGSWRIR